MEYGIGYVGSEKPVEKADIKSKDILESGLTNLASRELVEMWQSGSQEAASVLMDRYHVRLIALIASRLNRRLRGGIDPQDVVQSAMGSFFRVTQAGGNPAVQLQSTASAWNILATFARRKLSRVLERETAAKRGGGWERTPLEQIDNAGFVKQPPSSLDADECIEELNALLSADQNLLLQLLLENAPQREIAVALGVDERTVRRRIAVIRSLVTDQFVADTDHKESADESASELPTANIELPHISYRQFVLGKMIGRGAFGKVYRARMQSDDSLVAVKFMHRHLWADPISKHSFVREIDHASRINHPGIVKYLGWGESPHGGPFIVSELIVGPSLAHLSRADAEMAPRWLKQICGAIEAAHRVGVVHGDITPNNVLLDSKGRIVVTDFGFASTWGLAHDSRSHVQHIEPRGGTLGFAAPEQISSAFGEIGPATDIYAIGGIAYYLLTGCAPHGTLSEAMGETLSDEDATVDRPYQFGAEARLAQVAHAALKKAIADRPKSVRDLLKLLSA
ncbi:MAG: protein kinase [Planctomycetales bacterium]|nr:protein kinase [Planctomycetales bacterium]